MANGFEFFEGSATEGTFSPRVTIRKGGQLVLTQAAVDLLGEGTTHVQVGFNPETKAIGIRAAEENAKGRYRLRQQKSRALVARIKKGSLGESYEAEGKRQLGVRFGAFREFRDTTKSSCLGSQS